MANLTLAAGVIPASVQGIEFVAVKLLCLDLWRWSMVGGTLVPIPAPCLCALLALS